MRAAAAYADGDEILEDGSKAPLASVDPFSVVAGLGYQRAGRTLRRRACRHAQRTQVARQHRRGMRRPNAIGRAAFTILDATVFWRVAEMLTLRAGVFNLTDEKYAYWSDVRGLVRHVTR